MQNANPQMHKLVPSVVRLRQQGRICIVLQGDPGRLPAQLLKSLWRMYKWNQDKSKDKSSEYRVFILCTNWCCKQFLFRKAAKHHCCPSLHRVCVCVTYSFVHIVYYWLLLYDNKIYLKERIRNDASVPCISHLSNHPVAYPSTQSPQIELI